MTHLYEPEVHALHILYLYFQICNKDGIISQGKPSTRGPDLRRGPEQRTASATHKTTLRSRKADGLDMRTI
ncbi:hypothetical protein SAY86_025754 [Trapa natans]|uniref:Uncharacterized protein n=1 Tax=Trapa natans TaxID=22666 RepID=A0AAN7KCL6_TRANT|nr:hypothetical protein SAY86_025754 [Trapa natans]